jgi:putative oxidoreductase
MYAPTRPHPVLPTRPQQTAGPDRVAAVDECIRAVLRRRGPDVMRWTLGIVFVWFGVLKVLNVTPVAGLVADTLAFVPIPSAVVVPALGAFEVVAGVLLVAGLLLRPVLAMLTGHLVGTFLVLVTQPHVAFQDGNPFLLTTEGEFVVKNLVLIAGTLLVAAALPPLRRATR